MIRSSQSPWRRWTARAPLDALAGWVARLARYAVTKHGLADALRKAATPGSDLSSSETYTAIVAALDRLLQANIAARTLRPDLDAEDVILALAGLWQRTVASAPGPGFTLRTSAGQKVTIEQVCSTTYRKGATLTSASAIKKGESVVVLGTTNGATITASQIIVQTTVGGSAASLAAAVVPFQRDARSTSI
jgi:hypothetical protein